MNIDNQSLTSFTSRNIEIRKADKIMRQAMNHYPMVSTSRAKFYDVVKKDDRNLSKCFNLFNKLFNLRMTRMPLPQFQRIERIIGDTKRNRNGNCLEQAYIALAAFLANGYKDLKIGTLNLKTTTRTPLNFSNEKNKLLDHLVLIVNSGKDAELQNLKTYNPKTIIVDPWRGFVDYLPNAIKKYEELFIQGKRDTLKDGKKIKQRINFNQYDTIESVEILSQMSEKKYPEFVVK